MAAFNDKACWKLLSTCATREGLGTQLTGIKCMKSVPMAGKHHQADSKRYTEGALQKTGTRLGLAKGAYILFSVGVEDRGLHKGGESKGREDAGSHALHCVPLADLCANRAW